MAGLWKDVVKTTGPHSSTFSLINDTRSRKHWRLDLSCGHMVYRPCRYFPDPEYPSPGKGNSYQRSLEAVRPAPRRVRCEVCR